jgi:hypothetical protein
LSQLPGATKLIRAFRMFTRPGQGVGVKETVNYNTTSFRGAPGEIAAYEVYIKTSGFKEVCYCQAYNTATYNTNLQSSTPDDRDLFEGGKEVKRSVRGSWGLCTLLLLSSSWAVAFFMMVEILLYMFIIN